jgi:CelD/BcsL family acetyltransferase involved in cellulose biosynthesis
MTELTARVVTNPAEFESLAGVWDGILHTAGREDTIYLTHEWLSTWWRHFGEGRELQVLLFERQGRVVGAVPLMVTEHRLGVLKVRLVESVAALNYNYAWVVSPEDREEVASAFLSYLGKVLRDGGPVLRFNLMPDDGSLLSLLRGRGARAAGLALVERTMTLAPYAELPDSWEEYFTSLGSKKRWLLRRSLRRLEEDHRVEFRHCERDSLEQSLEEFFDLHQQRWRSVSVKGIFHDPRMRAFYTDIARTLQDKGWLHFSRLDITGKMAHGQFAFVYNGKFYASTAARDTSYSAYGVGHLHYMFVLQDAIRLGLREYDFLQGDEPYKSFWARSARRYQEVTLLDGSRWPVLRLALLRAFLRVYGVRRFGLRQSYHLHRLHKREERERRRLRPRSRG